MTTDNPFAFTQEFPRKPHPVEFTELLKLITDKHYPAGDSCATERDELRNTLVFAAAEGRLIISYAMSDSPGYAGPMAFIIWPDTSVTMYRKASIPLPSFNIDEGSWYECDKDGIPYPA